MELGLSNAAEVRDAFRRIKSALRLKIPNAEIAGIVVQGMAAEGIEMILGIKRDPLFGPVIVCGFGGIFVELLKDVAIGIPPVSRQQRIAFSRASRLATVGGVRGKPPADVDALCDAIVKVSNLAGESGRATLALDINPLVVHATNGWCRRSRRAGANRLIGSEEFHD